LGYTAGVFDFFHVGHLNLLRNASQACDHLIVGVTTDDLAEQTKGIRPLIPFTERMEIVQSLRFVDHVLPQTSLDKMEAWANLRYDVLFVGENMRHADHWGEWEQRLSENGARLQYLPYTVETASTVLREALRSSRVAD
jgi:glycerol-3-phosphate cytidylyltransferase